jgi:tetratricopeptide (TPR) repeat protein
MSEIHRKGKQMRLMAVIAALVALLVCSLAVADTVVLKNGDKIDGEILEETKEGIKIKTPYGELDIPWREIDKVTKSEAKPEEKPSEKPEEKPEEKKDTPRHVVKLKNGDKIEGEITKETEDAIVIKTSFGPLRIPRKEIEEIIEAGDPSKKLLEKRKALAEKHYNLAMWAKEKGLKDEARTNFEAAIELNPDHEKARAALGYVKKNGRWVKLEKKLTAKGLLQAHQAAYRHFEDGEYDKALKVYKRILKSYPDDLTANYYTACLLAKEKKAERALKHLLRAVTKARAWMDKGSLEEKQLAKTILDLLKTDSDLDNLRDTDGFKAIEKIAAGEKIEPTKKPEPDPKKEPDKPKKKTRDF